MIPYNKITLSETTKDNISLFRIDVCVCKASQEVTLVKGYKIKGGQKRVSSMAHQEEILSILSWA